MGARLVSSALKFYSVHIRLVSNVKFYEGIACFVH